jgi:hypothetical protein
VAALGLDRRARERPVVAPDARLGQVAMKAVRASPDPHRQTIVVVAREQALGQR